MTGEKKYCNRCQCEVETVEQILSEGKHYGKLNCAECGSYVCFIPKPKNGGKRKKNRFLPHDLGVDFCQMCLRHESRLGKRDVLESHHVLEIGEGGEDLPENILVLCTSCHRLTHHQRTYLNHHLSGKYSFSDLEKDFIKHNIPPKTRDVLKRIFLLRGGDTC